MTTQLLLPPSSAGGGSGASEVSELTDVTLVDQSNNDILVWTEEDGWHNQQLGGWPTSANDLDDVVVFSPQNGEVLKWNGANWVNAAITAAQVSDLAAAITAGIGTWVGAAPGSLDTLLEIANQLASDESAAAALATTVAGKLAIASNLNDLDNKATARTNLGVVNLAGDTMTGKLTLPSVRVTGRAGLSNINPIEMLGVLNHVGRPVAGDGAFLVGDFLFDSSGQEWLCTVAGTPGTWVPVGSGKTLGSVYHNADFTNTTAATDEAITGYTWSFTFDGRPVNLKTTPLMTAQDQASTKLVSLRLKRTSDNAVQAQCHQNSQAAALQYRNQFVETGPITAWPSDNAPFVIGTTYTVQLWISSGSLSKASVAGTTQPSVGYAITC